MYDIPSNRDAHDRLLAAFRDHMPCAPAQYSESDDIWSDWQNPDLLLSQTCGLPFRAKLHGSVSLVATPDNHVEGCPPGYYHSVIIARAGSTPDLADNDFTLAYNEPLSQSGWAAPASIGITGAKRLQTGSHHFSAKAVIDARADVAAIDALTWHFLMRDWVDAGKLKAIAKTPPTPTLPYITARGHNPEPIRSALARAILDIGPGDRETLQIFGLVPIDAAEYCAQPIPAPP
ncbi:MAG: phosphate/phosphite/phosphonate ABC transporter substrate-binding protein [Planktomarina sp.]